MAKSLEGNPVKPANAKVEYNDKMLEELANCSDPDMGYLYFITNYGHIKHPSRGMIVYEPFDYQYKLLNVYHNYRFSISMVGRQMGKALYENTPIHTVDGLKFMKDISVGDYVFNEYKNPVKVLYKTDEQVNRKCYKIEFSTGESIIADKDHNWNVVRNGKHETLTTYDLLHVHDKVYIQRYLEIDNKIYINSIDLHDSVPVYCIQVDNPSHLFLAGETMIPTHNCVIGDTVIKVRNKNTGEVHDVSIKDFHYDKIGKNNEV